MEINSGAVREGKQCLSNIGCATWYDKYFADKSLLILINLLGQYHRFQSAVKESWVQRDLEISPKETDSKCGTELQIRSGMG